MTDTNRRLVQESWRQVLDALRAGDALFDDPARVELDDHELALGYRNLTHILAFSIGLQMNADRDWPSFAPSLKDPPGEKTLGEHPDVHYEWAPIRGGRRYRITGQRGDEAYLSFTVHRGVRGSGNEQTRTLSGGRPAGWHISAVVVPKNGDRLCFALGTDAMIRREYLMIRI